MTSPLFTQGKLGPLSTANRLIRAGTSETMATSGGEVTPQLLALYRRLAAGGVGTIFTGHLYCHRRGQYQRRQAGIYDDALVPRLKELTDVVHAQKALILAQLAHAGSQSRVPHVSPLAPSAVPNALTGRDVPAASGEEIAETVSAFRAGARRAMLAGFDGVHIHAANGYLISEMLSPLANRRDDEWGGDAERRAKFALAVLGAVREEVPADRALTVKLGFVDTPAGGLQLQESTALAARLVQAGADAIEVSCGVMVKGSDSARQYVAVDKERAAQDLLVHRLLASKVAEGYFLPWVRALRAQVKTTVIAVGGMRSTQTMEEVIESGDADFVAMARPFIREPDLAAQIAAGRSGLVACTSCNICLMHEGHHSLRCWRTPKRGLFQHAAYRLAGGFTWGPRSAHGSTSAPGLER